LDEYFGPLKRSIEDGSPDEFTFESESHRHVDRFEATHLKYVADGRHWERFWEGGLGITLKGPLMNGIFFQFFALAASETSRTSTVSLYALTCLPLLIMIYRRLYRGNQSWPFNLIVKCETIQNENEQLRRFQPRSDLLVSKSTLPRLLVEVNSKPRKDRPEDLVRMLVTGAAIVRFANRFLDAFMVDKNFVLFAIYIWDDGRVTRYSLFQEPNNPEVCWALYITKLAG
jgi:hypothetical protein